MAEAEIAAEMLEDLLEQERRLVLAGEIGGLERLAARKAALVRRLADAGPHEPALRRLQKSLTRNAALLDAAGRGIADAGTLLAQARTGGAPLTGYDGRGRRHTIGAQAPSISRNA